MTNEEILLLVDTECPAREYVRMMGNPELVEFARAIEQRVMVNTKAEWYLMGAEDERRACAEICDRFQARDVGMQPAECASAIRARGE